MDATFSIDTALADLANKCRTMPPVAALQVSIGAYDGIALHVHAPLAANINDKGCAFGGSLTALMTLAGWGLVNLRLAEAGYAADVFVAESQVRYLVPLWGDLEAVAQATADASWETFLQAFAGKGRARIDLSAWVPLPQGGQGAQMQARYVAIATG